MTADGGPAFGAGSHKRIVSLTAVLFLVAACGTRYDTYAEAERANVVDKIGVTSIVAPLRGGTIEVYSANAGSKDFEYHYFFKHQDKLAVVANYGRNIYNIKMTSERLCRDKGDVSERDPKTCLIMAVKKDPEGKANGSYRHFALFTAAGKFLSWSSRKLRPSVDFSHDPSAVILGGYRKPGPAKANKELETLVRKMDVPNP